MITMDQYPALSQLAGEMEEHVAHAIDLYLETQRRKHRDAFSEKAELSSREHSVISPDTEDEDDDEAEDD